MRTACCLVGLILLGACKRPNQELITAFPADAVPLSKTEVTVDSGGWQVTRPGAKLFQVIEGLCDACFLSYRARVKTEKVEGRAFLEMWVSVPDKGEFFSKGYEQALTGTTEWTAMEVPFRLEKGQHPDVAKLNLVIEGEGTAWIRDIELWKRPF